MITQSLGGGGYMCRNLERQSTVPGDVYAIASELDDDEMDRTMTAGVEELPENTWLSLSRRIFRQER